MTEHNVFTKKHTEEVTQAKQTFLDELNLPPQATTFIRENQRLLQAFFLLVVLSICGRSYYIHYTTTKIDQSSEALSLALVVNGEEQLQALAEVTHVHAGTGAAQWASIALAKKQLADKQYENAITTLQTEIAGLKSSAPQLVLCKLLLAHAYESNAQNDLAVRLYEEVRDVHEFMVIGNVNLARIYEKAGDQAGARDAYEKALSSPALSQSEKDWLRDRIHRLSIT
ncbi:MAG: tetratricopeptide repeat protein [Spirochaetales bacterium]|jgi:predicted negative regulator of RcsB-dependent stress response|nr:tetratricopeptide repeat protein [Spirochaetales bacterium]